ncbi:MAG: lipoate--protein ligase [Clostridia bacterium]|nr:lipoate--protein ligase [Clostridia bacterium]
MEKFLFLTHDNHDPYFNLASEEYLLKSKKEYFIYLWINSPAVIVGKNQNTLQEVNLTYTEQNGIKVVRRLTGGGAVYHDYGNVCYTVIAPYNAEEDNYKKFTAPVIGYLKTLGVNAEFAGRNDILINGKKFSGNAQTIYGDRILHHGTILFKTDMSVLGKALNPSKIKMESKGIKSVRSRVVNVYDVLPEKITLNDFYNGLCDFFRRTCGQYVFTDCDEKKINELVKERYSTYEWNIGSSPTGKNVYTERFRFGTLTLSFDTQNGYVENADIHGDFFTLKDLTPFVKKLNGKRLIKEDFIKAFSDMGEYIVGADGVAVAEKIFSEN